MLYDLSRSVVGKNPLRKDLDFLKQTSETWFIPPEFLQEHSGSQEEMSGEKIDVYHLGVTMFISLYLKPPFKKAVL
jgi:serine/threonine protein kinase